MSRSRPVPPRIVNEFPPQSTPVRALRRLLLLEPDGRCADLVVNGLRAAFGPHVDVVRCATLLEATRAATAMPFDAAVVEWTLPGTTGVAALSQLQASAAALPVVVHSADLDDHLVAAAVHAGAAECLVKSAQSVHALPRAVSIAIERQRHLTEIEAAWIDAAHRAAHDPLTGLANRSLFFDHLDRALALGERYDRKTGLLFIDVDDLKVINDTHGHAAGDRVIRAVAARLRACIRRSDAVARIGGDEFVVLVPDVTSRRDLQLVRRELLARLHEPIDLGGGRTLAPGASIGCAMAPLDGTCAHTLLDAADAAMYREKYARRRGRMPTPALGVAAVTGSVPQRRESRLREALDRGEFEVHFQPIVDVSLDRVVGAEALLRWRTADRGVLGPSAFLVLAEDTGLIVPIGEFVLREASRLAVRWSRHHGAPRPRVTVNVSAVQVRERSFAARVAAILSESACPPEALLLELTEQSLATDGEAAIATFRALKAMGLSLIVDDFGVGHASLAFLREAPVDGIKIDRRFVAAMLTDPRDLAIVGALIRLARGIGLHVVAEGVESAEQALRLAELDCMEQQGRHFGDAMPADALLELVSRATGDAQDPMSYGDSGHGERARSRSA